MNESHGPISPEMRLIIRLYEAGLITAAGVSEMVAALMEVGRL